MSITKLKKAADEIGEMIADSRVSLVAGAILGKRLNLVAVTITYPVDTYKTR